MCDMACIGKQPKVLFQTQMMSLQMEVHDVVEATYIHLLVLMHKKVNPERCSSVSVTCLHRKNMQIYSNRL